MKPYKLSARKRLTKPVLFGTVLVGLATIFFNRHRFLEDVVELRAQERARNEAKRLEFLEMRPTEEVAEKKRRQAGSD